MRPKAFSNEGRFYKGNLHTHSTNSDGNLSPKEICKKYKEKAFSSGYPAGNPGDLALNYLGHVGLINKSYGVFERGLVYSIAKRSPFNLNSIGGLSGGPAFSKDNRLSGILVAENARRALAILVENKSLLELLELSLIHI